MIKYAGEVVRLVNRGIQPMPIGEIWIAPGDWIEIKLLEDVEEGELRSSFRLMCVADTIKDSSGKIIYHEA